MVERSRFQHRMVKTNGIDLHVVVAGSGPAVILCHGFPEYWYSWRHQMVALADAGYQVIAPDMRGFGKSSVPTGAEDYTRFHVVGDLIGLLDVLNIDNAVIVGHDWGTEAAWGAAQLRPDRFKAVVGLSVPFVPRGDVSLVSAMRATRDDSYYMLYFQQPGIAEKELEADVRTFLRRLFYSCSGDRDSSRPLDMSVSSTGRLTDSLLEPEKAIAWLTDNDLDLYVEEFQRTGFKGALNTYRSLEKTWELSAPWHNMGLSVPSLFMIGTHDIVYGFPGMKDAIASMQFNIPKSKSPILLEGIGHWIQNEAAEQVNHALIEFLRDL